jgi:hypothetical protein
MNIPDPNDRRRRKADAKHQLQQIMQSTRVFFPPGCYDEPTREELEDAFAASAYVGRGIGEALRMAAMRPEKPVCIFATEAETTCYRDGGHVCLLLVVEVVCGEPVTMLFIGPAERIAEQSALVQERMKAELADGKSEFVSVSNDPADE